VVAYHLGLPWAPGGFLGVDLFFVLSGFLITGLLVRERRQTGRIDLGRFYARRARRLLPALFVALAAVSLWVAVTGRVTDITSVRADTLAALGYVANWRLVLAHHSYFAQFGPPSPLQHAWSLAIEEQYYLLWPLILLALLRGRGSIRRALTGTLVLAAASVATMALLYHPGTDPSRVYYGTDTRAFELLIGAGLALIVVRGHDLVVRRWSGYAGAGALTALVVLFAKVHDTSGWMYRGGFLLAALLAAVAVWSASHARPGALLASAPLRWIGRISYGIYLWHWPVIVLLTSSRTGLARPALLVAQVAVTLLAATLSFHLVERPIRVGRLPRWPALVAAPLVASLLVTIVVTTPTHTVKVAAPARLVAIAATPAPAPPPPPPRPESLGLAAARAVSTQSPLRVLIVGDSVMWDASLGIKAALEATGAATVDAKAQLGFGLTRATSPWRTAWPQLVRSDRPDVVLALWGGWDAPAAASNGAAWYANLVDEAVQVLGAGGADVIFLEYPRNRPPDVPGKPPVDQAANERLRQLVNQVFASVAAGHAGSVGYLPVGPALDQDGQYAAFLSSPDGTLERVRKHDNIHFCPAGAARLGSWVLGALTASFALPAADPGWLAGSWRSDARYDNPSGACA
jgi:peptidoglycan/LPS O-acetylase OafA/YrhL